MYEEKVKYLCFGWKCCKILFSCFIIIFYNLKDYGEYWIGNFFFCWIFIFFWLDLLKWEKIMVVVFFLIVDFSKVIKGNCMEKIIVVLKLY